MRKFPDTWDPYREVERDPIQYTYCNNYNHISRYRGLRQVIHQGLSEDRFMALETVNTIPDGVNIRYYVVPGKFENRLDLIAEDQLGSATYAWIIAYFNKIQDGYTAIEGTKLAIPVSVSSLFEQGQILESVTAVRLNLGSE